MWRHGSFTTQSGTDDFLWPLVLRGVGLGLIFVPINGLAMANISPLQMPNATGLYNLMRQLGGSIGIASCATLLASLQNGNRATLLRHISIDDPNTLARLAALKSVYLPNSVSDAVAQARALAMLNAQVGKQAAMLSYERLFLGFGVIMLVALPLLLLLRRQRVGQAMDAH